MQDKRVKGTRAEPRPDSLYALQPQTRRVNERIPNPQSKGLFLFCGREPDGCQTRLRAGGFLPFTCRAADSRALLTNTLRSFWVVSESMELCKSLFDWRQERMCARCQRTKPKRELDSDWRVTYCGLYWQQGDGRVMLVAWWRELQVCDEGNIAQMLDRIEDKIVACISYVFQSSERYKMLSKMCRY